jgi:hypothetical protein
VVTLRGRDKSVHGGASVDGLPTAGNQNKVRGNKPRALAIMLCYEDLGGEAGKGVLTGGANGIDGESLQGFGKMSLRWS